MNFWIVKNPWIFYGVGGALVLYLLYMMFRRHLRKAGACENFAGSGFRSSETAEVGA